MSEVNHLFTTLEKVKEGYSLTILKINHIKVLTRLFIKLEINHVKELTHLK